MTAWLRRELFEPDAPETPGRVLQFKLFEAFLAFYAILIAWKWASYIQGFQAVVLPLGVANWLDVSFMFGPASFVNAGVITVGMLMGLFRLAPRWGYLAALLALHLHYAARYSLGEIGHSSHLIGMGVFGLAMGFWLGETDAQRRRIALGVAIFWVGFAYTCAAASKLVATGITWPAGDHLWLWIGEKMTDVYSKYGVFEANWLQQACLDHWWLATATLSFGLMSELVGVLMWWRRARPFVALGAIGLHLGIAVSMQIDFSQFIYQLIIMCFPWHRLFDRWIAGGRPALVRLVERFA